MGQKGEDGVDYKETVIFGKVRVAKMTLLRRMSAATFFSFCLLLANPATSQEFRPGNNVLGCKVVLTRASSLIKFGHIFSIAKRCSYNSPAQRSHPIPIHL